MNEIITVPLSYLEYYHRESLDNPSYSTETNIRKQEEIIHSLKKKGGTGEDNEVAMKKSDLYYFQLLAN